ncbi:MAG: DUF4255 domain-containing protein [Actinomycetia bacterium]|nr:DUF4255 domain-containing protein [Actinomycetes bacterium]
MTIVDLSLVSQALSRLIGESIAASSAWAPNPAPDVVPYPPDEVAAESLCWYLYAVGENPAYKNPVGPVASNPLALDLGFQLTVHGASGANTLVASQRQHLLFGLALKALHDHPVVDKTTVVNGVDLFQALAIDDDNSFSVELLPTDPEKAVNWWTASSGSVQVAAYYTVSVVMIEAEPMPSTGPPVLQPGVISFTDTGPVLDGTRSVHRIALPGATPQDIPSIPAKAVPGQSIVAIGSGFRGEIATLLRGPSFADVAEIGGGTRRVLDTVEELEIGLDEVVDGERLVAGIHSISIIRHDRRLLVSGEERDFPTTSNTLPIVIVPRVVAVAPPAAGGAGYVITGGPFVHPNVSEVRILTDGTELLEVSVAPSAGEFHRTGLDTIEFRPPTPIPTDVIARLRVIVNGVENLPFWVVGP